MLTETQRRRLHALYSGCDHEWEPVFEYVEGTAVAQSDERCIHCGIFGSDIPFYDRWDEEVCPLLAKIVERGEWEAFIAFIWNKCDSTSPILWMHGNYTDPSHPAGLIAEWLERKEGA